MIHVPGLRPQDQADFESVLRLALAVTDIRSALLDDPSGATAARLRCQALDAADEIAAAATGEYQDYLAVRAAAERDGPPDATTRHPLDGALWPALAVLTPLVAAAAAVLLLLIGCALRLMDPQSELGDSLVAAGWVSALAAVLSGAAGLAALLVTAIRQRGSAARRRQGPVRGVHVKMARERWQQALLERGMLPYLRRRVHKESLRGATERRALPPGRSADPHARGDAGHRPPANTN